MKKYYGRPVHEGLGLGTICVFRQKLTEEMKPYPADPRKEKTRLQKAHQRAIEHVKQMQEQAGKRFGAEGMSLYTSYLQILQDEELLHQIYELIDTRHINAEYAVWSTCETYARLLVLMENDEDSKERDANIRDVGRRVIRNLKEQVTGETYAGEYLDELLNSCQGPVILVATELPPSQLLHKEIDRIKGIILTRGSANSQLAIMARMCDIPLLIETNVKRRELKDGTRGIIDAFHGTFVVEPEDEQLSWAEGWISSNEKNWSSLRSYSNKQSVTKDGKYIRVMANVGSMRDVAYAKENGAEGIGLFRSEFIFMKVDDYPSEELQYSLYSESVKLMGQDNVVVIRTADIGADNRAAYMGLDAEKNEIMGLRGIRLFLRNREHCKTQLRAIYRAAANGYVAVMYPMVSSELEMQELVELQDEVEQELKAENAIYAKPLTGIMIETPAAVMISDKLAKYADFFSLGTNDLTQLTLGIDAENAAMSKYFDPHHEAVLRMIKLTIDNAHAAGIQVGICGELAGDEEMIGPLVEMGIDAISVAPVRVLPLRRRICEL